MLVMHVMRPSMRAQSNSKRRKYSPKLVRRAKNKLRTLLKRGLSVDQAANQMVIRFPTIKPNTLRNMAYYLAKHENFEIPTKQIRTIHEKLKSICKKKFQKRGYEVLDKQNEIRRFMKQLGSTHVDNPDLMAIRPKPFVKLLDRIYASKTRDNEALALKENDVILIEVVEREKGRGTLISQLERYSKVGKLIVVLPVDTRRMEVMGMQAFRT